MTYTLIMLEDTTWGCGSLAECLPGMQEVLGSAGGWYRPLIPALGRQGKRIFELAWFTKQVLEQPGCYTEKPVLKKKKKGKRWHEQHTPQKEQ